MLQLSADTLQQLNNYHWAGNIRELRNVIERAVILADDDIIQPQDLPSEIQQQTSPSNSFSLVEIEKTHIRKILQYTDNNKTKTAKLLGIGLATLYRKIEEYGLNK